jgi:hypothetical protein
VNVAVAQLPVSSVALTVWAPGVVWVGILIRAAKAPVAFVFKGLGIEGVVVPSQVIVTAEFSENDEPTMVVTEKPVEGVRAMFVSVPPDENLTISSVETPPNTKALLPV